MHNQFEQDTWNTFKVIKIIFFRKMQKITINCLRHAEQIWAGYMKNLSSYYCSHNCNSPPFTWFTQKYFSVVRGKWYHLKANHDNCKAFSLTLAMSKIWAAVSVQCQAFLMKNDFSDSEWYGYVFLVKKHVKPYIFSFSRSWATKWLLWQLPLESEKSKMATQNGRQSPHKWLYTKALCGTRHLRMVTVINWVA